MRQVEYRVRPVVRYVVTRWHSEDDGNGSVGGGCETVGEFHREEAAERVRDALAASELI